MNKRQKAYTLYLSIALVVYICLVVLLYLSESKAEGSTIITFGDALWYSLVTLTTVGYGDITPVTTLGHAIGLIFLILAAGTMVTMLSAAMTFISSEGLPLLRLKMQKKKNWYYFADCGMEAQILAENIVKEDDKALIIFGERQDERQELPDYPCIFLNASPARIVAAKKGEGSRIKMFLMKENDIGFNTRATNLHKLPIDVYANSTNGEETLSGNIHFFHAYDCCAREYWRTHPLLRTDRTIVLIGFDHYGRRILERAILNNVLSLDQHVAYHIFGDAEKFLVLHPHLSQVFSINKIAEDRDSLIFHKDNWGKYHDLIDKADRIIIAQDDVALGWDIFWRVKKYYRYHCHVDLRNSRVSPGVSYFGTDEDIYTPEHIMRIGLNKAAIAMNELFRKSVDYPTLSWGELDDFHRQSKIAAADHLLCKIRILLEDDSITDFSQEILDQAFRVYLRESHDPQRMEELRQIEYMRWIRFYYFYNWQYGEQRDDVERCHPMLCGYENLTEEQKIERHAAWDVLGSIAANWKSYP